MWRTFSDGERSVDYVLAYARDETKDTNSENDTKREIFCANLQKDGLELEYEKTQRVHFIKIHAPKELLRKYTELLRWEMPVRSQLWKKDMIDASEYHLLQNMKSFFGRPFRFIKLDPVKFPQREAQMFHEYSRDKEYLFDIDEPGFFTNDVRIAVVNFILERTAFIEAAEAEDASVGIQKLLNDKVFRAAYPLHDVSLTH